MPSSPLDVLTLRLFCHLASVRSFSRTAQDHQLTQSAVSQRIRQLEERLDVRLLDRSVRPFELTSAGELLEIEGRRLVAEIDQVVTRVRERGRDSLGPALGGEVKVDAIFSAGIGLLCSLSADFEARHPTVDVTLEYKRPEEVADSVRGGRCDFGIISYPKSWREVRVTPLRDERMCVVCGPSHPLAGRKRVRAGSLDKWRLAAFDPTLPVARGIRRYLREQGASPMAGDVVDNIETMKMLVQETDQIAILPMRTIGREVEMRVLHAIELEPRLVRPMAIIRARRGRLKPAARALSDFLVEQAGPLVARRPRDPSRKNSRDPSLMKAS